MTSSPDKLHRLEDLMPHIRATLAQGQNIAIGPKGTSMLPLIRQGIDFVELAPLPERLKKYDLPLYQRDNGQYVLHRIVKAGETYTCIGDNQYELEKGVRHDQMIAVMAVVYRGEKHVPVTAFSYKVYCRLWHWTRPVRCFCLRARNFLRKRFCKKK